MKKTFVLMLVGLFMLMAVPTQAATMKSGESFNLVHGEQATDDLYVAAGVADIGGIVTGDLTMMGGKLSVTGNVQEDLNIAGGMVDVMGTIGDDVRVAGGVVTIDSRISGDLVVTGGMVHVRSGTQVQSDLIVSGGTVIIDGEVIGETHLKADEAVLNGQLNGAVIVEAENLKIGPRANILEDITYRGLSKAEIAPGANLLGKVSYEKGTGFAKSDTMKSRKDAKKVIFGLFAGWMMYKFIIIYIAALLMIYIFKKASTAIVNQGLKKLGDSLFRGVITMIVVPVVIIFSFITIFFPYIGVALALVFALVMCVAKVMTGVVFGSWLFSLFGVKKFKYTWLSTLVGMLVLGAISLVPAVGWLFPFFFMLVTFGAIVKLLQTNYWEKR